MKTQNNCQSGQSVSSDFNQPPIPQKAKGSFCISTGNKTLYHLTLQQLKKLHLQLRHLPEKLSHPSVEEAEKTDKIQIQENTVIYEDEHLPSTFYYIYSQNCEIQMATYAEIKKISEMLLTFLEQCGQNFTDIKQIKPDPDFPVLIDKDPSLKSENVTFKSAININKRVVFTSQNQKSDTHYMVSINEQCSSWLTQAQLVTLYQELGKFLKKRS